MKGDESVRQREPCVHKPRCRKERQAPSQRGSTKAEAGGTGQDAQSPEDAALRVWAAMGKPLRGFRQDGGDEIRFSF